MIQLTFRRKKMIDLRSDTVTKPTEEMKKAMMMAEVGDDVYGEDPTVNELQEYTADLLGKEAALFVPSGTMSNQIGIKINTNDGDEIIAESEAHIYYYETAAPSLLSRVQFRLIDSERGEMNPEKVKAAIRPDVYYYPKTSMICVENTHNRHGGSVISLENTKQLKRIAEEHGMAFHLDGARLWNASAATGISEAEYVKDFDSISVCLSKGLGAPVGSVLVGTKEKMKQALKWRKILGGGMRQAGILAAAGLYALKENRQLLAKDHINAKTFAKILNNCEHLKVDMNSVKTNMIIFDFPNSLIADKLIKALANKGVLVSAVGVFSIRAVMHFQIEEKEAISAAEIITDTVNELMR